MELEQVVRRDPEIHGGDLVFNGTRGPVDILVSYLKKGHPSRSFSRIIPRSNGGSWSCISTFLSGDWIN